MFSDLKPNPDWTNEDVVKWVSAQIEATREPGKILPAWMVDAFKDAMEQKWKPEDVATLNVSETIGEIRDDLFNFDLIYFKVENTTFSVIKEWLMAESSPFPAMFSLPSATDCGTVAEGVDPKNPIVLQQTSATSFKAFLRLLYGPRGYPLQTCDEWIGALELAMRWNFEEVRERAIAGLDSLLPSLRPAARILLARRFSIGPWLREGLVALVTAVVEKRLTRTALACVIGTSSDTKHGLDMATIADVFYACFELASGKGGSYHKYCEGCLKSGWNPANCSTCKIVRDRNDREKAVDDIFGEEIASDWEIHAFFIHHWGVR